MIQIITDTASDITYEQAKQMNVKLVELPINFEDGPCHQGDAEDFENFYERLRNCEKLPVTSRPAPQAYLDLFLKAKEKGDDVLVLTMSEGLSGTIESALEAVLLSNYDRIRVVDTHQAILTQRLLVEYAVILRNDGYDVLSIEDKIIQMRDQLVVCGVVDTLKYLRKGGRIPAGLAAIGEKLHIKPVIMLKDTKLKTIGKVRSFQSGVNMLYHQMETDGYNKAYPIYFGYTDNRLLGERFMQATQEKYGLKNTQLYPVGGIIGTHCGTNCVAVAYMKTQG